MAQANAVIGIGQAAFYPSLTLSADGGFNNSSFIHWFSWPSRFFSIGPSISETVFDAGLRRAAIDQYVAVYNADLASYRQTVLTAFQQVEDYLAETRILFHPDPTGASRHTFSGARLRTGKKPLSDWP